MNRILEIRECQTEIMAAILGKSDNSFKLPRIEEIKVRKNKYLSVLKVALLLLKPELTVYFAF